MNIAKEDLSRITNYEKRFKFNGVHSHSVLGKLKSLKNPSTEELVFMKEYQFQSIDHFENEIKRQKARIQSKNRYFINFFDFSSIMKRDRLNQSFCLRTYMEYFSETLESRIVRNRETNQIPSYEEIIRIFLFIINAGNFLHSQRKTHGEIRPSNILLLPNGEYRLLERLTNMEHNFPKNHLIRQKRSHSNLQMLDNDSKYFCPSIFGLSKTMKDVPLNFDKQKSEIFSVGLCLLEFGTGKSIHEIFNSTTEEINVKELSARQAEFSRNYSRFDILSILLINMLEPKVYQRKYFSELILNCPHMERMLEDLSRMKEFNTHPLPIKLNESFVNNFKTPLSVSTPVMTLSTNDRPRNAPLNETRVLSNQGSFHNINSSPERHSNEVAGNQELIKFSVLQHSNHLSSQGRLGVNISNSQINEKYIQISHQYEQKNLLKQPISFLNLSQPSPLPDLITTNCDKESINKRFFVEIASRSIYNSDIVFSEPPSENELVRNIELRFYDNMNKNVYNASFKKTTINPNNESFTSGNQNAEEKESFMKSSRPVLANNIHSLKASVKHDSRLAAVRSQQQSIDPHHKEIKLQNPLIFNVYSDLGRKSETTIGSRRESNLVFVETSNEEAEVKINQTNEYSMNNQASIIYEKNDRLSQKASLDSTIDVSVNQQTIYKNLKESTSPQIFINNRNGHFLRNEVLSPLLKSVETPIQKRSDDHKMRYEFPMSYVQSNNKSNLKLENVNSIIKCEPHRENPLKNSNIHFLIPTPFNPNFTMNSSKNVHTERLSSGKKFTQTNGSSNSIPEDDKDLQIYQFSARETHQNLYQSKFEEPNFMKHISNYNSHPTVSSGNANNDIKIGNDSLSKQNSPRNLSKFLEPVPNLKEAIQSFSNQPPLPPQNLDRFPNPLHLPTDRENRFIFVKRNSCDQSSNNNAKVLNRLPKEVVDSQIRAQILLSSKHKPVILSQFQGNHKPSQVNAKSDAAENQILKEIHVPKPEHRPQYKGESPANFSRYLSPQITNANTGFRVPAPPSMFNSNSQHTLAQQSHPNKVVQSNDRYFNS